MDCLFRVEVKKARIPFLSKIPLKISNFSHSVVSDLNNKGFRSVAGSSIGLVVGRYAATKDVRQVSEIAFGANRKSLLALIDPWFCHGLFGEKEVNNVIKNHFDRINLKNLKTPLSAVSRNFKPVRSNPLSPISKNASRGQK